MFYYQSSSNAFFNIQSMRRSRGENILSKKTFTRVFENEFGPRERKPRKKKNLGSFRRAIRPRVGEYDQIRVTKRTCVELRFSVVEYPRRFATSAIARLFLSPRSRWMPFPITLRSKRFLSFFSLFSLSNFLFVSLPLLFFRGPSFLAFENFYPSFRAISLDHRVYSSSTRARSEVSFRSFSLLTRQTHSSRSNTGGFDRFFTT